MLSDFVPFAGNIHDLQNRKTSEGKWFMETVRKVNLLGDQGGTTQGFYVVDSAGNAFGFNNNRSVERVLSFAADGKRKFSEVSRSAPMEISLIEDSIPDPPSGALVLRIYQRIIPVPPNADPSNANVQIDHLWMLDDEIASLSKAEVPDALQLRLVRFVFNDAIRGEPDMWTFSEIKKRSFKAERRGGTVDVRGEFEMQTADGSRGLVGNFEAEVSFSANRLTSFKAIADTTAWGRSTYTPNPPAGKFPLKFAIVMLPANAKVVAPQAAFFGTEYLTGK